jgi:WD40 repeat protein
VTGHSWEYRYAVVRDGKRLSSGGRTTDLAAVDLWDAESGKHVRSLVPQTHGGGSFAVWSADSRRILTVEHTRGNMAVATIYDVASGERTCSLQGESWSVYQAAFSPDGKLVLGHRWGSIVKGELVEVWDAATGTHRFTLQGHRGDVTTAEFSPDSRLILTTSTDGTARLWYAATGELRQVLRGHRHIVRAGRFSPDGKWIATASKDGTARIWKTEGDQEWMTLSAAHGIEFVSVEFSSDSQRILTASTDGTARVWPVDPLPLAESRKPRELTADERTRFQVENAP